LSLRRDRFRLRTALTGERWSIRACQCSFCSHHCALSTSDPAGRLRFEVDDPALLLRYRFATRSADFLICRRCGVYVGAQLTADSRVFGIINVHALRAPPSRLQTPVAMSYEGEGASERLERRLQRWTPMTHAG
jgi:hypothetical protein